VEPDGPAGPLDRLDELSTVFGGTAEMDLELAINQTHTEKIDELRREAAASTAQRGELAFRLLEVLDHLE
jgi:hypothetical protein